MLGKLEHILKSCGTTTNNKSIYEPVLEQYSPKRIIKYVSKKALNLALAGLLFTTASCSSVPMTKCLTRYHLNRADLDSVYVEGEKVKRENKKEEAVQAGWVVVEGALFYMIGSHGHGGNGGSGESPNKTIGPGSTSDTVSPVFNGN